MSISTYFRPNIHQNGPEIIGVKHNLHFFTSSSLCPLELNKRPKTQRLVNRLQQKQQSNLFITTMLVDSSITIPKYSAYLTLSKISF
jgi:hypothetical protein